MIVSLTPLKKKKNKDPLLLKQPENEDKWKNMQYRQRRKSLYCVKKLRLIWREVLLLVLALCG